MGADGGHSDTGSWRSEQRTEMGADESVMICHGYFNRPGAGATLICWLLCVGAIFWAVFSFTGALASFNDKFVVQRQTTPPKKPDNMAPN